MSNLDPKTIEILLYQLTKLREEFLNRFSSIDHKLDTSIENVNKSLQASALEHKRMNDSLEEHIKGVNTNSKRLDLFQAQIHPIVMEFESSKLVDAKITKSLKKYTLVVGAILTTLGLISKLLGII